MKGSGITSVQVSANRSMAELTLSQITEGGREVVDGVFRSDGLGSPARFCIRAREAS